MELELTRLTKEQSRLRWSQARDLWNEWDPIGVFSIGRDWPRDEYESYVGPTLRLLERGASTDEIVRFLDETASGHIGLTEHPDPRPFAVQLQTWFADKWPDSVV
jgi:hypothetical protein